MSTKPIKNDDQIVLPPILYKYRDWEADSHSKILTDAEFYFAHPMSFNDPFDVGISISYDKLSKDEWESHVLWTYKSVLDTSEKSFTENDIQIEVSKKMKTGFYKKLNEIKHWQDVQLKSFQDLVGIFSATQKRDNLLMWSHYANNHKGFCLGIDSKAFFRYSMGSVFAVNYLSDDKIPDIKLNDKEPMEEFFAQLEYKSPLWSYEKEYRYVKTPFSGEENRVFKFPKSVLKEVVFGCAMNESNKNDIMSAIKSDAELQHINLFQANKSDKYFKLDIKPI